MTLDELEYLLARSACAEVVFGVDHELGFRHLAKVCHPDRFEANTADSRRAELLFKRLSHWKRLAEQPPRRIESPERV